MRSLLLLVADWLMGQSRIGWLKTALLSGLAGFAVLYFYSFGDPAVLPESKFLVIALGYPVLVLFRYAYWDYRVGSLLDRMVANNISREDVDKHFESIEKWSPSAYEKLNRKLKKIVETEQKK